MSDPALSHDYRTGLSAASNAAPQELGALALVAASEEAADLLQLVDVADAGPRAGTLASLPSPSPSSPWPIDSVGAANRPPGTYICTVTTPDRNDAGAAALDRLRRRRRRRQLPDPMAADPYCTRHGEFDPRLFTVCPHCRTEKRRLEEAASFTAAAEPTLLAKIICLLGR